MHAKGWCCSVKSIIVISPPGSKLCLDVMQGAFDNLTMHSSPEKPFATSSSSNSNVGSLKSLISSTLARSAEVFLTKSHKIVTSRPAEPLVLLTLVKSRVTHLKEFFQMPICTTSL